MHASKFYYLWKITYGTKTGSEEKKIDQTCHKFTDHEVWKLQCLIDDAAKLPTKQLSYLYDGRNIYVNQKAKESYDDGVWKTNTQISSVIVSSIT